jgi:hypothetical protein
MTPSASPRILVILSTTLALLSALAESPPEGYVTHQLKEINGSVLRPADWHVTVNPRQKEDGPLAYQITKEDLKKLGGFKTGLTINVFEKIPQHHSAKPSEFAAAMMKRYATNGEVVTFKDGIKAGPVDVARLRLKKTMTLLGKETETMLVFTTMANDKTGTCYIFIFGTPAEEWAVNEKVLAQMSQATLDDER